MKENVAKFIEEQQKKHLIEIGLVDNSKVQKKY